MQLREAIAAAGLTPPNRIVPGRFIRFPGIGKNRSNRAGWLKVFSPTLAVFGDFANGLTVTWKDETHLDTAETRRLLREAREQQRKAAAEERRRARAVEREAVRMLEAAKLNAHPYLKAKGFPHTLGLVGEGKLLIPIRAVEDYSRILSMQTIAADGTKRFLPGGRTKGGIHRLGPVRARVALCEGFATALSVHAALKLLPGPWAVIVCFSVGNLVTVAPHFPGAIVCADNDASKAGEQAAIRTGLKWVMPPQVGEDFNDMHRRAGLVHVVAALRRVAA